MCPYTLGSFGVIVPVISCDIVVATLQSTEIQLRGCCIHLIALNQYVAMDLTVLFPSIHATDLCLLSLPYSFHPRL